MSFLAPTLNSVLTKAGYLNSSNAINTMVATSNDFVRAGIIKADKSTPEKERNQISTWILTAVTLSLAAQASIFKSLGKISSTIAAKNLNLAAEYTNLAKLSKNQLGTVLKQGKGWEGIVKSISKNAQASQKTIDLVKKTSGSNLVKNLKMLKGGNEFMLFAFGVVLFTSYIIPAIVCKYLPNIMQFCHDHIKINGKPIVDKPTNSLKNKKKRSALSLIGTPLLLGASALAFLRFHKLNMTKGLGKALSGAFKKISIFEQGLSPAQRIVRIVIANMLIRPVVALLDGNIYLSVRNFTDEALALVGLGLGMLTLGQTKNGKGLVGLASKALKAAPGSPRAKGIEFILTHIIQTFMILGAARALVGNKVSSKLTKKVKEIFNIKDKEEQQALKPLPLPASKLNSNSTISRAFPRTLSKEFDAFIERNCLKVPQSLSNH